MSRRNWFYVGLAVLLAVILAAGGLLAVSLSGEKGKGILVPKASPSSTGSVSQIKNVVLILADDLDWEVYNNVPRLAALSQKGVTFTDFSVTESLCCPSRTSILRSQYVHNHGVISNKEADGGGWPTFRDGGLADDCLGTWLHDGEVSTAFLGKFLNEYPEKGEPKTTIPPGWDYWSVPVSRDKAYHGWDYTLNTNGVLKDYGTAPDEFLNTVNTGQAVEYIKDATAPFYLQFNSFLPHNPAPAAPQWVGSHAKDPLPAVPGRFKPLADAPSWLVDQNGVDAAGQAKLEGMWTRRLESSESLADSVDAILDELKASGHDDDTLVIFTSDNGFHLGTNGMANGKRSPYDTDTVVPLVLIGPGMKPGVELDTLTTTIDLAPTVAQIFNVETPEWIDGRSLMPVLKTLETPGNWRQAVLTESLGASTPGDPDYSWQMPPSHVAVRTGQYLYVRYSDGQVALFDRVADPYELDDISDEASPKLMDSFAVLTEDLSVCKAQECRDAENRGVFGEALNA